MLISISQKIANIMRILRSIEKIELADEGLEVQYNDTPNEVFTIPEYNKGSFTRELLELIEKQLIT